MKTFRKTIMKKLKNKAMLMICMFVSVLMATNALAYKFERCNEVDSYTLPDGTVVYVYECNFIADPRQVCPFADEGTLCIIL